jgi:phosphopantothenoylcysteine decarboxylase/phosphopantothenate--cysteine ligase
MKKNVLLGVCGGISSYKTCELVRRLTKDGFSVKVIMTEASTKFVTPLVFRNLSKNPVYIDMFSAQDCENTQHISLAQWAQVCVVAPASANTLSKIANGICDNLLTTVVCALPQKTKVVLAAAMNENMWKNPIIQDNIEKLKKLKKYVMLNPKKGELACGIYGEGRMVEPIDIFKYIKSCFKK